MLYVRIAGKDTGIIEPLEGGDLSFTYVPNYNGVPLSVLAPIAGGSFTGRAAKNWFDNLLPDRTEIRKGMANAGDVSTSTYALLGRFGLELPGAIQIYPESEKLPPAALHNDYLPVSKEEIGQRLRVAIARQQDGRPDSWPRPFQHWSLAGNQPKLAFYKRGDEWFDPVGTAPSNVIVKPGVVGNSKEDFPLQALSECISMHLAQACGLVCANTYMENFDGVNAVVVERFDRLALDSGTIVRLHHEDLCQAFGVSPQMKYTKDGGPGAVEIATLLKRSGESNVRRFVQALLFSYLIMAPDAHAKNYSILHRDESSFTLAPLYDVATGAPYWDYRETKVHVAMGIGGETQVGKLGKSAIARFEKSSGLESKYVLNECLGMTERINAALTPVFNEFDDVEGIDQLAETCIPRIRSLCQKTSVRLIR